MIVVSRTHGAQVAMKLKQADKELLEKHYEDLKAKPFFPGLVEYMLSGPVVPMVRLRHFPLSPAETGSARCALPFFARNGERAPPCAERAPRRVALCPRVGSASPSAVRGAAAGHKIVRWGLAPGASTIHGMAGFAPADGHTGTHRGSRLLACAPGSPCEAGSRPAAAADQLVLAAGRRQRTRKHAALCTLAARVRCLLRTAAGEGRGARCAVLVAACDPVPCALGQVWEGDGVVKAGRVLLGATKPSESAPGSIRGDYCIDVGRNICHGSDAVESANKEIALWFSDAELCDWKSHSEPWIYE